MSMGGELKSLKEWWGLVQFSSNIIWVALLLHVHLSVSHYHWQKLPPPLMGRLLQYFLLAVF